MIDYKLLKQLREETGVSFSLCKKALEETDNNIEKAKKKLTEWGAQKVDKVAERETKQGGIFTYVHHNRRVASVIELMCETDFVSGNDEFKKLGNEIAMQIASIPAQTVEEIMEQNYIREAGKTIKDLFKDAVLKFGENIKIGRFSRWTLGE